MSPEEFLRIFEQILNEFVILNEHFASLEKSKTVDYDSIFFKWVKDMDKRFRNIFLSMHWATSAPLISKNQLLFDAKYRDSYFCEVKYIFSEFYTQNFRERFYNYLDNLRAIISNFNDFNKGFSNEKNDLVVIEYEKFFITWKSEIYSKFKDVVIDLSFLKKTEKLYNNYILLNILFKDELLFELKSTPFIDKDSEKYISMDEYLDLV